MEIKEGESCAMGVWNHLDGKRVFVVTRSDGSKYTVRVTEGTKEITEFELDGAQVKLTDSGVELSGTLFEKLKAARSA